MIESHGVAATAAGAPLEPFSFARRDATSTDVVIEVLHCGVCHTDVHSVNNDWGWSMYPLVPGHEIVGRVTEVGDDVTKFRPGDLAGIGCLVDSCRKCARCEAGEEHACERYPTPTYGGFERGTKNPTYGGYSNNYVVDERFALRLPAGLDAAAVAPLLCAGITTYSPLRYWQVGSEHTIGVVGLGGLGHMAVKLGRAFGARVVMFTTSPGKAEDARRLGADDVIISTHQGEMRRATNSIDFILDTVAAEHDVNELLKTLRRDGTLCLVGMGDAPTPVSSVLLAQGRKRVVGSAIGGLAETQEMLDFCGTHGISADIEPIAMDQVNDAYSRLLLNDVKYRFVIDLATL